MPTDSVQCPQPGHAQAGCASKPAVPAARLAMLKQKCPQTSHASRAAVPTEQLCLRGQYPQAPRLAVAAMGWPRQTSVGSAREVPRPHQPQERNAHGFEWSQQARAGSVSVVFIVPAQGLFGEKSSSVRLDRFPALL